MYLPIEDSFTMSRIFLEENFEKLAGLVKNEPDVAMVYDLRVEDIADEIAGIAGIGYSLGLEASEERKTMETVLTIERFLLNSGARRNSLVLAVGGGIISDITGFAASIFKRGVRFAIIPTTLLSMVDASIGGKTGVNLDSFKNMVGCFAEPEFTYITPEALKTLPVKVFVSGSAELLKSFIIGDAYRYHEAVALLSQLQQSRNGAELVGEIKSFDSVKDKLLELIAAAAAIKDGIASRDPFEKGERRKLNLGHTFAHAIEWRQSVRGDVTEPLSHGEAVAVGIIQAAAISEAKGLAPAGLKERLEKDFIACGLPSELPYPLEELEEAMLKDKKNLKTGEINYVLIKNIGEVI